MTLYKKERYEEGGRAGGRDARRGAKLDANMCFISVLFLSSLYYVSYIQEKQRRGSLASLFKHLYCGCGYIRAVGRRFLVHVYVPSHLPAGQVYVRVTSSGSAGLKSEIVRPAGSLGRHWAKLVTSTK